MSLDWKIILFLANGTNVVWISAEVIDVGVLCSLRYKTVATTTRVEEKGSSGTKGVDVIVVSFMSWQISIIPGRLVQLSTANMFSSPTAIAIRIRRRTIGEFY
jgi:hypothetical protein